MTITKATIPAMSDGDLVAAHERCRTLQRRWDTQGCNQPGKIWRRRKELCEAEIDRRARRPVYAGVSHTEV